MTGKTKRGAYQERLKRTKGSRWLEQSGGSSGRRREICRREKSSAALVSKQKGHSAVKVRRGILEVRIAHRREETDNRVNRLD